ncbi:hypothetical protein IAD21_04422 [Abditibacteriota bacterium]|nr:hypothetical protein IAD21_04422 [Abditibacteriota bacterium]
MRPYIVSAVIAFLFAVLIGVGAISYVNSIVPFSEKPDDFLKISGVIATLTASALAAVLTTISTLNQANTAREIEKLKGLLTQEYPALKQLNAAAYKFRDALTRFSNGRYDAAYAEACEVAMAEAAGGLFFTSDGYQEAWEQFQQRARSAKEEYALVDSGNFEPIERIRSEITDERMMEYFESADNRMRVWLGHAKKVELSYSCMKILTVEPTLSFKAAEMRVRNARW